MDKNLKIDGHGDTEVAIATTACIQDFFTAPEETKATAYFC